MAKFVALDSNLALLFVVGATDRSFIGKHKRLSAYEPVDYDLIFELLDASAGIILCPNVVSETSNLIRYAAEPTRARIAAFFADFVKKTREDYLRSGLAVEHRSYPALGVTDSVLLSLAASGAVLLTDDLDLYLAALRAKLDVINFTHERAARF
jgi:hypothetical protein